jgi:CRISPR type III-B/RAMP module RAMP protein Cmr6
MAGGVQENAGLSLDRCFGLPLIPGSAVKGVARHTALWEIRNQEDSNEKTRLLTLALLVFGYVGADLKSHPNQTNWHWAAGDTETLHIALSALPSQNDFKGIISFLQASPADGQVRIVAEGITPHTDQAGQEMSPNPLTFPAVERGSNFGFALVQNRRLEEHTLAVSALDQAATWLRTAITGTGIGAKTSAGYGWFTIDDVAEEARRVAAKKAAAEAAQQEAKALAEVTARAALTDQERHASDIAALTDEAFIAKAKDVTEGAITGDELSAFFQILSSDEKKNRRKQWRKKKPDLWEKLVCTASTQGIEIQ